MTTAAPKVKFGGAVRRQTSGKRLIYRQTIGDYSEAVTPWRNESDALGSSNNLLWLWMRRVEYIGGNRVKYLRFLNIATTILLYILDINVSDKNRILENYKEIVYIKNYSLAQKICQIYIPWNKIHFLWNFSYYSYFPYYCKWTNKTCFVVI